MYKSILFGFAMLVSVTSMVIMAPNSARTAYAADGFLVAEENVFIDEGDGDFAVPTLPKDGPADAASSAVDPLVEAAQQPAAPASELDKTAGLALPEPAAPVELGNTATDTSAPLSEPAAPSFAETKDEATEQKAEAAKPAPKAKSAQKRAKVAAAPKAKAAGKAKGKFVAMQKACPMFRGPASEGSPMLTVKDGRRIWVEEVDASWVRAFNRKGEPGYVSTECVK